MGLTKAVSQINADNLALDFPLSGNDEISVLATFFNNTLVMIRESIAKNERISRERHSIELQSLQEQANPHFLYNTLSAVASMAARIEAYDIYEAVVALSKIYRHSLSHGDGLIPIAEELKMIELYVHICHLRFGDRLTINLDIDLTLAHCLTPRLIVQPFIENAIMHGLQRRDKEKEQISICLQERDGSVQFRIIDNGIGISAEQIRVVLSGEHSDGRRHAISSIDRRLKLHFGEPWGVHIASNLGQGTEITVTIPKIQSPDEMTTITRYANRTVDRQV